MNRLKSSVLMIVAILMIVSLSAMADETRPCPLGHRGGPGMEGRGQGEMGPLGRMAEELGLTDEQKAEIRAIIAEEMPAAHQRIKERVAPLLTAEQLSRLEELKEEHPGMGRGRRGHGAPGARLERMAAELELTDDQKTAIREIFAEAREEKRGEVQEKINSVLSPEQQEKLEALHERRGLHDEKKR